MLLATMFHESNAYVPVAETNWSAQKFKPWNVHGMWYVSYGECEPWCRAHCATKRTPDYCFLSGPFHTVQAKEMNKQKMAAFFNADQ
uniref:Uncharacterized protein n=1 Tax=Globodera rostochiensis TaxID=31243 RepID=A0A914HQG7_GLORO